jgi:hypothetical protein
MAGGLCRPTTGPASTRGSGGKICPYLRPLLLGCEWRQGLRQEGCVGPLQGLPLCRDQVGTFVSTKDPYNCVWAMARSTTWMLLRSTTGPASMQGSGWSIFLYSDPLLLRCGSGGKICLYSGPLQLWCGRWQGLRQEGCVGPLQGLPQVGTIVCTQGPYYCSVSGGKGYGRRVVLARCRACLYVVLRWEHLSVLRAPTIVVKALARSTAGTLWRPTTGPASMRGSGGNICLYSRPLSLWCGCQQGLWQRRCGGPLQGLPLRWDQVGTFICI